MVQKDNIKRGMTIWYLDAYSSFVVSGIVLETSETTTVAGEQEVSYWKMRS